MLFWFQCSATLHLRKGMPADLDTPARGLHWPRVFLCGETDETLRLFARFQSQTTPVRSLLLNCNLETVGTSSSQRIQVSKYNIAPLGLTDYMKIYH
ncbi:hypothetical protein AMELA_G00223200, partial [Ameiurus melas]